MASLSGGRPGVNEEGADVTESHRGGSRTGEDKLSACESSLLTLMAHICVKSTFLFTQPLLAEPVKPGAALQTLLSIKSK